MRRSVVAAIAALSLWSSAAQSLTGNDISEPCSSGKLPCEMYVYGALDGMNIMAALHPESVPFCIPPGVSQGQLVLVVRKYLGENPAQLHITGSLLVMAAFKQAFPCSKKP